MPVQLVARPSSDFRGFAGTIAGGSVRPGDEIRVLPRDTRSTVERIVTYDGDLDEAVAGQAVTLTLADEIDASRGDMIAAADDPPGVADQFEATVVWMADDPMYRGRNYLMRIGSQLATATIAPLKYKLNVNTLEHMAATKLELNEIGVSTSSSTGRSRSTPTTPTARPAASSSSTASPTRRSARACSASRCGARRT